MRTDQMVGSHADPGGGSGTATKSGGGTGVLKVDGKVVAEQKMQRSFPFILQWDENLDIGADTGTPVDDRDYKVPFKFTGKLNKVTLTIDRPTLTPEDIKRLKAAQHAKAVRD